MHSFCAVVSFFAKIEVPPQSKPAALPAPPRGREPSPSRLAPCHLPRKGEVLLYLPADAQPAPPSGELAANAVSRLRGCFPPRRAFAESGAAAAVSLHDSSREKVVSKLQIKIIFPLQRRRPPPVAETGRSCWGSGQQDASAAQGTMRMLGAATRKKRRAFKSVPPRKRQICPPPFLCPQSVVY